MNIVTRLPPLLDGGSRLGSSLDDVACSYSNHLRKGIFQAANGSRQSLTASEKDVSSHFFLD